MRINHRALHDQLRKLGYEIYTTNYKLGGHYYHIEGKDDHEYSVEKHNGEKVVNLYGIGPEIIGIVKEHYQKQGVKIRE